MPLPLIFIGIAAVTATAGIGKGVKAGFDNSKTNKLKENTQQRLEFATNRIEEARKQCSESLSELGEEKIYVLNGSIKEFIQLFSQLKNVDFKNSLGLEELDKFHVDSKQFEELSGMSNLAASVVSGGVSGALGGALTAFGAWGAVGSFGAASTGTAIASLSGAAATNATLAFFGGGSLAAGGLGMAGGAAVLGGLVAGPALLIAGSIIGAKVGKNLENAKADSAEASVYCEELENGTLQCIAIRRRTDMFYTLLARQEAYFVPLLFKMKEIIENRGVDYSKYSLEEKKIIASTASIAVAIKSVIDTPILSEDGSLTEESELTLSKLAES